MAARVYVVTGSEDGVLGVAGNVEAAVKAAEAYCETQVALNNARHVLSHTGRYTVENGQLQAVIERFTMNKLEVGQGAVVMPLNQQVKEEEEPAEQPVEAEAEVEEPAAELEEMEPTAEDLAEVEAEAMAAWAEVEAETKKPARKRTNRKKAGK